MMGCEVYTYTGLLNSSRNDEAVNDTDFGGVEWSGGQVLPSLRKFQAAIRR